MPDPFQGQTPEQYLASFAANRGLPTDPNSAAAVMEQQRRLQQHKVELVAQAAEYINDADDAPQAKLLGRYYEPPTMWEALKREIRGTGRSEVAWGLRHTNGMWHPQSYEDEGRAKEVRDALIVTWLEGVETPLVLEFNTARGETETVEEWKMRQGIGAVWCSKCPNPRQPDSRYHPNGQEKHV